MITARLAVALPLVALLAAACGDGSPGSSLPPLSSFALSKTFHRVDTPPLGLPPLDPDCQHFPVTGGRFEDLDHDGVADVVLAVESGNALVLRWDGASLQQTAAIPRFSNLHEMLVAAAD